MSFVICVTGKSGSGKSTFAKTLSKFHDCIYVDVDKIGHEALKQKDILHELCQNFGKSILNINGEIERKKLGEIVFHDKESMQVLTTLTWRYMENIIDFEIERSKKPIVIDWSLLPNTKYWKQCNVRILIQAQTEKRKMAVLKRDNISENYFDVRDLSGLDYSLYSFDYVFENDYTKDFLSYAENFEF